MSYSLTVQEGLDLMLSAVSIDCMSMYRGFLLMLDFRVTGVICFSKYLASNTTGVPSGDGGHKLSILTSCSLCGDNEAGIRILTIQTLNTFYKEKTLETQVQLRRGLLHQINDDDSFNILFVLL